MRPVIFKKSSSSSPSSFDHYHFSLKEVDKSGYSIIVLFDTSRYKTNKKGKIHPCSLGSEIFDDYRQKETSKSHFLYDFNGLCNTTAYF